MGMELFPTIKYRSCRRVVVAAVVLLIPPRKVRLTLKYFSAATPNPRKNIRIYEVNVLARAKSFSSHMNWRC